MKILRVLFLFGLIIGFGFIVATPANAMTFPGENGVITFTKERHNQAHLWMLQPKNGDMQYFLKHAKSPAWSPNGKLLAFVGEDRHIWVTNKNGDRKHQVTKGKDVSDMMPVWSADGARLAFVRERSYGGKQRAIMTISADGQQEMNISGWGKYRSPSWSPRGTEIVYENYGAESHTLFITHLITKTTKKLVTLSDTVESRVTWSLQGNKILYADSSNEIYTIWADGSHRTVISDGESYDASWSPDGKRIAFVEDPNDDHISISEEDGTVYWITFDKGIYETIGAPVWSPDGTKLLLPMSYNTPTGTITDSFLLTIIADPVLQKIANGALEQASWQAR